MNEFSKTKIAYSLALLAALFALHPLVEKSTFNFQFFVFNISVSLIYWTFVCLLASTVYLYALSLIKEEKLYNKFHVVGNYIYAFSLLFPFLVFLLIGISALTTLLSSQILEYGVLFILSTVVGVISSFVTNMIVKKLNITEKLIKDKKQRIEEFESLVRVKKLYDTEMYDLVVIESWKILNTSFRRLFKMKAIPYNKESPMEMIQIIRKNKLLPEEMMIKLYSLRDVRNKVSHTEMSVSKEDAYEYLKYVEKVLTIIEDYTEECYFCRKIFPLNKLEVEDLNGDYYACEKCIKENPDWKDQILDLGMDP